MFLLCNRSLLAIRSHWLCGPGPCTSSPLTQVGARLRNPVSHALDVPAPGRECVPGCFGQVAGPLARQVHCDETCKHVDASLTRLWCRVRATCKEAIGLATWRRVIKTTGKDYRRLTSSCIFNVTNLIAQSKAQRLQREHAPTREPVTLRSALWFSS